MITNNEHQECSIPNISHLGQVLHRLIHILEAVNPSLHDLEHFLLDTGATSCIIRVVEGFEDLQFICEITITGSKSTINNSYLVDHAIGVLIVKPSLCETGVRNNYRNEGVNLKLTSTSSLTL